MITRYFRWKDLESFFGNISPNQLHICLLLSVIPLDSLNLQYEMEKEKSTVYEKWGKILSMALLCTSD